MGTYKIVKNADFSANNVGKLDIANKIFRRKINGVLERNYIEFTRNYAISKTPIDLSKSNIWDLKIHFFNPAGSVSNNPYYSIADYVNKRAFYVQINVGSNGQLGLIVWMANLDTLSPYNVKTKQDYNNTLATITFNSITEHILSLSMDFSTLTCSNVKFDGVAKGILPGSIGNNQTVLNDAATTTISIGSYAFQETPSAIGLARPSFIQLSQNNKIELHHDFLGDNDLEIYTEKAKGILLQKGAQIVHSAPISI